MADHPDTSLIDWIRPSEADGLLKSAVFSTYGLSLDQPDFFSQDFLPTLVGLGSVRDRGYASPITLDRTLSTSTIKLVCDAHALAAGARPTLRVDVTPIGHKLQHAKVILIHRAERVRLVIGSANLTHEGFRRQREVAVVLDFHKDGRLSPSILREALDGWRSGLEGACDREMSAVFDSAVADVEKWSPDGSGKTGPDSLRVLFGGGPVPLWEQIVAAWPAGEPVLRWHICSPFWPDDQDTGQTPFEAIADGLQEKGCSLEKCSLEIIARAAAAHANALPSFPFQIVERLRKKSFAVQRGTILPARLEAAPDEIPDGMAAETRNLHAKWIVLSGTKSAIAFVGSANFTRKGLGVVRDPTSANIEAGVLFQLQVAKLKLDAWRPPIEGKSIDWATCAAKDLGLPNPEEDKTPDWPDFIQRIDLSIRWGELPDPSGNITLHLRDTDARRFSIAAPSLDHFGRTHQVEAPGPDSTIDLPISALEVRAILSRRTVDVTWKDGTLRCSFPVNIEDESKAGMPSVLGARPSEDQLLSYFHGKISEDDLLHRLEEDARNGVDRLQGASVEDAERLKQLQSYIIREFVEGLYGLSRTLQTSSLSVRGAEQVFLGDLSPVALAEQVYQAFMSGKRSPTAACFQLVEVARVVAEVCWLPAARCDESIRMALDAVRQKALDRVFSIVRQAKAKRSFADVMQDPEFSTFVETGFPPEVAKRWLDLANEPQDATGRNPETASHDS